MISRLWQFYNPRCEVKDQRVHSEGAIDVIFRVSLSLIFIIGGLGHFGRQQWMLERLQASPWLHLVEAIGQPVFYLEASGLIMIVAGVALFAGLFTRLSATLLFVTLVPITFVIHVAPDHVGPLFKNVAILGALLHFIAYGASRNSLDSFLSTEAHDKNTAN